GARGQLEREGRTAGPCVQTYLAVHPGRELLRDREPKAGAAVVGLAGEEAVEDLDRRAAVDPRSAVGHRDLGGAVALRRRNRHMRAARRVPDRVVEEDAHDLGDALAVARDLDSALGHPQLDVRIAAADRGGELAGNHVRELGEVYTVTLELE